ncbi:MAG: hypothetical protein WCC00_02940 [Candidatus Aminicenantales bacterium]
MTNNADELKVEIRWVYVPAEFFEEKIVCEYDSYSVEIEGGQITARMSAAFFDSQPGLPGSLRQNLNSYFLGAQPIRRRVFEIHGGAVDRLWPDGRRDTTLVVQDVVLAHVLDQVDLIQTDDKGVVVGDTKRDRIEATKHLAELSARYYLADPTLRKLLDSFDASVRYPGNELIYLYEIWDALQTKFRRNKKGRKALGISRSDRSWLTNLANKEPLNQGRHRGRFDTLQDATFEDLAKARLIAKEMIEKFLLYLDGPQRAN